eukprot:5117174-Pyramimonas_sp.AAC.1
MVLAVRHVPPPLGHTQEEVSFVQGPSRCVLRRSGSTKSDSGSVWVQPRQWDGTFCAHLPWHVLRGRRLLELPSSPES